jgi:hypothetical protein
VAFLGKFGLTGSFCAPKDFPERFRLGQSVNFLTIDV